MTLKRCFESPRFLSRIAYGVFLFSLSIPGCGGSSNGNGAQNQADAGQANADAGSSNSSGGSGGTAPLEAGTNGGGDANVGGTGDSGGGASGGTSENGGSTDTGGVNGDGGSTDTGGGGTGGSVDTGGTGDTGGSTDIGGTGGSGGSVDTGGAGGSGGSGQGGCLIDTDCPLGQVCNVDICVDGCGPPTGGPAEAAMSERCPIGQACVPYNCLGDPEQCFYECDTLCANWPCHSDADHSFICWGRETFIKGCMQECDTNSNCPDGQECLSHSSLPAEQQGFDIGLCRAPCTTDDDCLTMQVSNLVGYGDCTCQAQGLVGAGHCLHNPTPNGGFTCLYTAPP